MEFWNQFGMKRTHKKHVDHPLRETEKEENQNTASNGYIDDPPR